MGGYTFNFEQDYQRIHGRLNPATHSLIEYLLPTTNSHPHGIAVDAWGYIWFTENWSGGNSLGRLDPNTHTLTEYRVPTASSGPEGIALAYGQEVWFTETTGRKIGKFYFHEGVPTFIEFSAVSPY